MTDFNALFSRWWIILLLNNKRQKFQPQVSTTYLDARFTSSGVSLNSYWIKNLIYVIWVIKIACGLESATKNKHTCIGCKWKPANYDRWDLFQILLFLNPFVIDARKYSIMIRRYLHHKSSCFLLIDYYSLVF